MEDLNIKYPWYKELWWNIWYYCWDIPKTWYYNIKWLLRNIWRFKKILWNYRTWDFSYCNNLFADSLDWLAKDIINGMEEERSANKKAKALKELSALIRKLTDDSDFELADKFINKEITAEEYRDKYNTAKKAYLDRIYRIIYGQTEMKYSQAEYEKWVKEFDGTGYESWWN